MGFTSAIESQILGMPLSEGPLYSAFWVCIAKVKAGIKLKLKARQMNFFSGGGWVAGVQRSCNFAFGGDKSHMDRPQLSHTHTFVFNQMRIHMPAFECVYGCVSKFLSYLHLFHFSQRFVYYLPLVRGKGSSTSFPFSSDVKFVFSLPALRRFSLAPRSVWVIKSFSIKQIAPKPGLCRLSSPYIYICIYVYIYLFRNASGGESVSMLC